MELMQSSKEWATRPDDQRYLSLEELRTSVAQRRGESWTATPRTAALRAVVDQGELKVIVNDPTKGEDRLLLPSHWGFGQLASYANAPASYLRRLPDELAAINLQWGLESDNVRPDALVLAQTNGHDQLRAVTSQSYGRIWDQEVVDAVIRVNSDGRWQIPAASYAHSNPKRATTLYASDRDVFLFLVDPANPIEVNGEQMFRGFYAWNSEVGAATFGLTTFLYRYVCDNRIIWGATEVNELRIRHTGGAPDRFAYEGARYLNRYANETTYQTVQAIERAQAFEIPKAAEKGAVAEWLQARGFTGAIAKAAVQHAESEEGQARSLWDVINGITAYARSIQHTDARVQVETDAGKLMKLVA